MHHKKKPSFPPSRQTKKRKMLSGYGRTMRSTPDVTWLKTTEPKAYFHTDGRTHPWYLRCTAASGGKRATQKFSTDNTYDHPGYFGSHPGRYESESEANADALNFRAFFEFGRGKDVRWRSLTGEERLAKVAEWTGSSGGPSSKEKTGAGAAEDSFVKSEGSKAEDAVEEQFRLRAIRRTRYQSERAHQHTANDKKAESVTVAQYMDEQVKELLEGAKNIKFVSDANDLNARQALKVTKQCYAVSSFYAARAKREWSRASGIPLNELEKIHDMAIRIAAGFGESGRTLRRWFEEWDVNSCFQPDQRGTSSASTLIAEEEVEEKLRVEMIRQVKLKGKDSISVDSMHVYINDVLLPSLDQELKTLYGLSDGHRIARTTAYEWMKAAGGVATWFAPV